MRCWVGRVSVKAQDAFAAAERDQVGSQRIAPDLQVGYVVRTKRNEPW